MGPEATDTVWDLQWGAADQDSPLGIDVGAGDAVFVGGFTDSDLVDANRGKVDGWIGRMECDGTRGGRPSSADRPGTGSSTSLPPTRRCSPPGTRWTEVAPDGPGGNDGFVAAFDPETGAQQWLTLVGTPEQDWGQDQRSPPTAAWSSPDTRWATWRSPTPAGTDAFIARLSPAGAIRWTAQIGSAREDWTQGVDIRPGAIAIAGYTDGELTQPPGGDRDALVAVFEADDRGILRWVQQFGTDGTDSAFEPRFVGDQVVITGTAGGVFGTAHAGGRDSDGGVAQHQGLGEVGGRAVRYRHRRRGLRPGGRLRRRGLGQRLHRRRHQRGRRDERYGHLPRPLEPNPGI